MTNQVMKLNEIVTWFRSKQRLLEGSDISIVDVRERAEHLPAVAADFVGEGTAGRINGWTSGEFDFEAIRVSDGKDLFVQQISVSSVDSLENTYADFIRHLRSQRR